MARMGLLDTRTGAPALLVRARRGRNPSGYREVDMQPTGIPILDDALERADELLDRRAESAAESRRLLLEAADKLDAAIVTAMRACGLEVK
jgi:hypothetical protein